MIFDEGVYWAGLDSQTDTVIERVKEANFNTYIPCVWHGQGAIWPSNVAPLWYKNRDMAVRDPLSSFIEKAHKNNIKVMPCFTVMARQHSFFKEYSTRARPSMFNVHDQGFRNFIKSVVLEVVKNYDIDGINLDYVRAGQVCFEEKCRLQYKAHSGHDLMKDISLHKFHKASLRRIVAWQREAVGSLVEEISKEAKAIKPDLLVTVSAAPWAESIFIEGQNSIQWANEGWVDKVLSMNYQRSIPWEILKEEKAKLTDENDLMVMVANYFELGGKNENGGLNVKPKPLKDLLEVIQLAREFNGVGDYAVYLYSMLSDEHVLGLNQR